MFLFYIIYIIIINIQFIICIFNSHDCVFKSNFNYSSCSWKLNQKFPLNDQGLIISSTIIQNENLLQSNNDVIELLTSSIINPGLIKNSQTCSVELSLFSETGFDGYKLNWLLSEHNNDKIHQQKDIHQINSGIFHKWSIKRINLSRPKRPFKLVLELIRSHRTKLNPNNKWSLYVREIRFVDCGRDSGHENCLLRCDNDKCLSSDEICDVTQHCSSGLDEQNCADLPNGAYLSYADGNLDEYDWANYGKNKWLVKDGSVNSWFTTATSNAEAIMQSPIFPSINSEHRQRSSSLYNMCKLRFYHWIDFDNAELIVSALELENELINEREIENSYREIDQIKIRRTHELCRYFQQKLDTHHWTFTSIPLPQGLLSSYRLKFVAKSSPLHIPSLNKQNVIRIANLSLSKECFSKVDSSSRLQKTTKYKNYFEPLRLPEFNSKIKGFRFNSCGKSGSIGPTADDCLNYYNKNSSIKIIENGIQNWIVPNSGYYTFFLAGGKGGDNYQSFGGEGAFIRAIIFLEENERLIILVGQNGESSCYYKSQSDQTKVCDQRYQASGGGGASYVFSVGIDNQEINNQNLKSKLTEKNILLIAGGGGGSGSSKSVIKSNGESGNFFYQFIPEIDKTGSFNWTNLNLNQFLNNKTNNCKGETQKLGGFPAGRSSCKYGGSGDGYSIGVGLKDLGGAGGTSYFNKDRVHLIAFSTSSIEHEDYSFATKSYKNLTTKNSESKSLLNQDQRNGFVLIYPQLDYCCQNTYPCVITNSDELENPIVSCVCSSNSFQVKSCSSVALRIVLITIIIILIIVLIISGFLVYKRYEYKFQNKNRRRQFTSNSTNALCSRDISTSNLLPNSNSTELQLNRLRNNEFYCEWNPNYQFGQDEAETLKVARERLKQIPHENIELVKALGKGAFGEVYQGFYYQKDPNRPNAINKMQVAVKTLPEFPANKKAGKDFLTEALLMSKYSHRNIVSFIGITLEQMPRLIIIELMEGGDLKTFLRDNRGTPQKACVLNMGDLIVFALDVARACLYLSDHKFIHRDLAARNILLTNKVKKLCSLINQDPEVDTEFNIHKFDNGYNNSGIVAKLADFGLAKDIYRSEYYKKGNNKAAPVPVKWWPPEAIEDGVFTSKTDVWSFGILLWEVFSFGFNPYPGKSNHEVIQFVRSGGRPEKPNSSVPSKIWCLLEWCLEGEPEKRPNFNQIISVLGQCLTDKEILSTELTKFTAQTSSSGNASNETFKTPSMADSYLTPLISPNSKFEFINRHNQRNKSIATIDTNSPGTGNTCSTVTTIVYGSKNSNDNSNTSGFNSLQNNINSRSQSISSHRRRNSRSLIDNLDNDKRLNRQILNEQLNEQFNEQINEHLNDRYRPFLTKISGSSLNKLSEIFKNKDSSLKADSGSKNSNKSKQIKSNLFNKINLKSTDVIELDNPTIKLSNTEIVNDKMPLNKEIQNKLENKLNNQANQTTTNNELILNPTSILNGHK